jgi:CRISPR-associated protein Cas2
MILERVPPGLRGELSRWMIEPHAGVFVGTLKPIVREKLWMKVCSGMKGGAGTLIFSSRNEQGFEIRFWGAPDRSVVDYDGLKLIQLPKIE